VEYKGLLHAFVDSTFRLQHSLTVNDITYLGKGRLRKLTGDHLVAVHYVVQYVPRGTIVQYFDRIIVHREIVHSHHYCRNLLRNSYTVSLNDGGVFQIEQFVVANFGDGVNGYALGYHYKCSAHLLCKHPTFALKLHHLVSIEKHLQSPLVAIPVVSISRKCILVNRHNCQFDVACLQLNMFEDCA
jgi:hypothetical protein